MATAAAAAAAATAAVTTEAAPDRGVPFGVLCVPYMHRTTAAWLVESRLADAMTLAFGEGHTGVLLGQQCPAQERSWTRAANALAQLARAAFEAPGRRLVLVFVATEVVVKDGKEGHGGGGVGVFLPPEPVVLARALRSATRLDYTVLQTPTRSHTVGLAMTWEVFVEVNGFPNVISGGYSSFERAFTHQLLMSKRTTRRGAVFPSPNPQAPLDPQWKWEFVPLPDVVLGSTPSARVKACQQSNGAVVDGFAQTVFALAQPSMHVGRTATGASQLVMVFLVTGVVLPAGWCGVVGTTEDTDGSTDRILVPYYYQPSDPTSSPPLTKRLPPSTIVDGLLEWEGKPSAESELFFITLAAHFNAFNDVNKHARKGGGGAGAGAGEGGGAGEPDDDDVDSPVRKRVAV